MSVSYLEDIGILSEPTLLSPPPPKATATAKAQASPAPSKEGAQSQPKKAAKPAEAAPAKAAPAKAAPEKAAPAAKAPAGPPPAEKTPAELAKMTKEERKAYHEARRAAEKQGGGGGGGGAAPAKQLTKAERRALQEAQRKVKEDSKQAGKENEELLAELKLQGLSEDQAREVMNEMLKGEEVEEDDSDDDEVEDLASSTRRWMKEQPEKVAKDAMRDFNMKVRFQGHVDTTPPDHIACILMHIFEEACSGVDLKDAKLQPQKVAKKAEPLLTRWAPLLEPLYEKIDDVLAGTDAVCKAVQEALPEDKAPETARATAQVGCFMALREIDMIEDEDLLTACRRLEPRSKVMDKFIDFLDEDSDEDDD
eukprot:CAMPEP_0197626184 /NCGR_PEP_ID=MMETSP1338-20131121/5268_1 /TAXON_ID=43686 ORGANISM="Pelagodinium beii, Strain RCC1491" /NCGR_SAMPLE_ID=MMETSP1338 /ASSEMBLY_ACC=CAM_ASM_000754 /LENGTH=365 /DNA_ID=CAMNT_0043196703 /DNA_START=69 /DNA_END=1166 /DNA_ORIENTATION=-